MRRLLAPDTSGGDSESAAQAVTIAKTYAEKNGIKDAELITDGSGNVAYVPGPNYNTITVTAKRTVPYTFFKLIGFSNGKVAATATAQMPQVARVCELHQRDSHAWQSAHRHPGKRLQHRRPMQRDSDRSRLEQHRTRLTSPSRSTRARSVPATGARWRWAAPVAPTSAPTSPTAIRGRLLSTNGWIPSLGSKRAPSTKDSADRIAQAQSEYPSATFSQSYPRLIRARLFCRWLSGTALTVEARSKLWLLPRSGSIRISGGTIKAHFIDVEAFNSTGDPNAPFRGARGRPLLIK